MALYQKGLGKSIKSKKLFGLKKELLGRMIKDDLVIRRAKLF